jgi:hypothetical protein
MKRKLESIKYKTISKQLVLKKLPIRYFTRTELNKKTKRSLITLCLEYQRVIISLVKVRLNGVGKRITKRKALPYNGRIDKRRKKKRKFSRKQLAAQRLFAKRARAGTLRRR